MPSRADLQMKFGDEVQVNCQNCGKLEKKHLNKISAQVDNRIVLVGFLVGLCLAVVLMFGFWEDTVISFGSWKLLAAASSGIAALPMFLWNSENKKVGHFNRYAIRRK